MGFCGAKAHLPLIKTTDGMTNMSELRYDFDLFVIGGGSGGVRAARRTASLGLKVGIAEEYRYGGTCVIRGCVPKKLFVYASQFSEAHEDAVGYGWSFGEARFDWTTLMANKDKEIERLENAYRTNVAKSGAEVFDSRAELEGAHDIRLLSEDRIVTADKIMIATGGRPSLPNELPGVEHCIDSNAAFHLKQLPKAIAILGGGYIAVEFANIFHGLGVDVTLVYRGEEILRGFDDDLRGHLHLMMVQKGIRVLTGVNFQSVGQRGDGRFEVALTDGEVLVVGEAMMATGRNPNTENLGCDAAGVKLAPSGAVVVDDYSKTSAQNIWAIGDVTDRVQLTPVAIHEAMCFVDTEFRGRPTKPDYDTIPTAVFSQPEIGTVGLSETQACETYDEIEIYKTTFKPMKNTLSGRAESMMMKLVVDAASRKVIGVHIIGPDAGEMAQTLGIAVKAGVTKDQFDSTMALHPSAAEELVTMYEPTYRVKLGEKIAA